MYIEYIGNILYDKKILQDDIKLVIFGCGMYGKKIAEYLVKKGIKDSIICFCDSNNTLEHCDIMGIPVHKPIEICRDYPDANYLIGGKFSREMYEVLKKNMIKKIHIIVF